MKFYNVNTQPASGSADGTYYVKRADNPDLIDMYVVSKGVVRKLDNSEDRVSQIESSLTSRMDDAEKTVSQLESKLINNSTVSLITSSNDEYKFDVFNLRKTISSYSVVLNYENIVAGDAIIFRDILFERINWGDGTVNGKLQHVYTESGDFEIVIAGVSFIPVYFTEAHLNPAHKKMTSIQLGDGITLTQQQAFANCTGIRTVDISPSSRLARIEGAGYTGQTYGAFYGCSSLTDISLPASLKHLGLGVFYNCTSLHAVTVPRDSRLEEIGAFCFRSNAFDYFFLPKGVKILLPYTFSNNKALKRIEIGADSLLETIESVHGTDEGSSPFYGCTALTEINLPSTLKNLGARTFLNCTALTNVGLGKDSQLEVIGERCFTNTRIPSFFIPKGVQVISSGAFSNNTSLISVTFDMSRTLPLTIQNGNGANQVTCAFYNARITSIDLPATLIFIGTYAFVNCTQLVTIKLNSSVPPELPSANAFQGVNTNYKIYIPKGSLPAYSAAPVWSTLISKFVEF